MGMYPLWRCASAGAAQRHPGRGADGGGCGHSSEALRCLSGRVAVLAGGWRRLAGGGRGQVPWLGRRPALGELHPQQEEQ